MGEVRRDQLSDVGWRILQGSDEEQEMAQDFAKFRAATHADCGGFSAQDGIEGGHETSELGFDLGDVLEFGGKWFKHGERPLRLFQKLGNFGEVSVGFGGRQAKQTFVAVTHEAENFVHRLPPRVALFSFFHRERVLPSNVTREGGRGKDGVDAVEGDPGQQGAEAAGGGRAVARNRHAVDEVVQAHHKEEGGGMHPRVEGPNRCILGIRWGQEAVLEVVRRQGAAV